MFELHVFQTILFSMAIALQGPPVGPVPGFEIVQITDDPYWDSFLTINDCGEAVYAKRINQLFENVEIFHYDNGATRQLTTNDVRDTFPTINEAGLIVWAHDVNPLNVGMIQVYDNGTVTDLTIGSSSRLNNLGHLTFMLPLGTGCVNGDVELYLYDGNAITLISDVTTSDQAPDINESDDIVWVRFDFCVSPWTSEIMMWAGGEITQLTENLIEPNAPAINNVGQIAFKSKVPADEALRSDLKLLEGGRITQLSDWGGAPDINDSGTIAFNRWHSDEGNWQVWYYRDGEFFQITDGPLWNADASINEWGEIAWIADVFFPNSDIKYMRLIRTGESDFDGHIDLKDAAAFQNCMTGPGDFDGTVGGFDRLCDCRFLDIDHDRDVDRDDYALFATAMTGPQ